jgi:hypothetical protein
VEGELEEAGVATKVEKLKRLSDVKFRHWLQFYQLALGSGQNKETAAEWAFAAVGFSQ